MFTPPPGVKNQFHIDSNEGMDVLRFIGGSSHGVESHLTTPRALLEDTRAEFTLSIENGTPPTALLKTALGKSTASGIEFLVGLYFDDIATGEFEWIADLKRAGCSDAEIVRYLHESAAIGPWVNFPIDDERRDKQQFVPSDLLRSFHQPLCVHSGNRNEMASVSNYLTSPQGSEVEPSLTDPGEVLRVVGNICGLGGLFVLATIPTPTVTSTSANLWL
jgi:hypothetical protein